MGVGSTCRAEISNNNDRPIRLISHRQPDVSGGGFTNREQFQGASFSVGFAGEFNGTLN